MNGRTDCTAACGPLRSIPLEIRLTEYDEYARILHLAFPSATADDVLSAICSPGIDFGQCENGRHIYMRAMP